MKRIYHLFSIVAIALIFCGCEKEKETTLEVTVINTTGHAISGATVKLYSSLENLQNGTNVLHRGYTNESGVAIFENIQPQTYYVHSQSDCSSSYINGLTLSPKTIVAETKNTMTSTVRSNGTLKITNESTNPYKVYLDGSVLIERMLGGTSATYDYVPTESYTVRVVQLSGYILYPTDKTYTKTLYCGGTLYFDFP